MTGDRLIDMKDPKVTEALEMMLDVFSGGDNKTFLVLLGVLRTMDTEEFANDWRAHQVREEIKGVGRFLKSCRRQSNGEFGQTSEETE